MKKIYFKKIQIFSLSIACFFLCNSCKKNEISEISKKSQIEETYTKYISTGDLYHSAFVNTSDGGFIHQDDYQRFVILDSIGNCIYNNLLLYKLNASNQLIWNLIYGCQNEEVRLGKVIEGKDGSIIFVGSLYNIVEKKSALFLVKTDGNGAILWEKKYDIADIGINIMVYQTSDEGFVIAANLARISLNEIYKVNNLQYPDFADYYQIIKTDKTGEITWIKTSDGTVKESINNIIQTEDYNYLVTLNNYNGNEYTTLVKLEVNGNINMSIDMPFNWIYQEDIIQANDGGYIFAAVHSRLSEGTEGADDGKNKLSLVKFDNSGNIIWHKEHSFLSDVITDPKEKSTYPKIHIMKIDKVGYLIIIPCKHFYEILKFNNSGDLIHSSTTNQFGIY